MEERLDMAVWRAERAREALAARERAVGQAVHQIAARRTAAVADNSPNGIL